MRMTIRADKNYSSSKHPLSGLGDIDIESPALGYQNVDSGVSDTIITVGGVRYLVTDMDMVQHGHGETHLTVEVAPEADDPRDEAQSDRQPQW